VLGLVQQLGRSLSVYPPIAATPVAVPAQGAGTVHA
jgi:hypothetical protein